MNYAFIIGKSTIFKQLNLYIMQKYQIKIGQISWFENAKGIQDLKEKVSKTIEGFHPLNSSEEGAEEYRKRFRNKPFYYKLPTQKDFVLCYNE